MKPTKGYYSVIQYCPDPGRFEAANVGVLLFCPETGFLRAITSSSNTRIKDFFGKRGHDWKRINAFKRGLEQRLATEQPAMKTVDNLREFIAMRANLLQLTPPLPIKIENPQKAQQDLQALFQQIVGEPERKRRKTDFKRTIGEALSAPDLKSKIRHDVKVNVPVLGKTVQIPYGFQNGRFNLIKPVKFGEQDSDESVDRACKYAVQGESLYQYKDAQLGELKLIVVGQFLPQDVETPQRVERVLQKHHVELYRAENLPNLVELIRRTGKDFDDEKTRLELKQ
jgi:hypothetical protein